MSHLDSLAGLDSMVLHINSHSKPLPTLSGTTATLDGDSYVLVPRKMRKLERARRTPLADKTASFNIVCFQPTWISLCTHSIDLRNRMAVLYLIVLLLVN